LALVHVFDSITPSLRVAGFEDEDEYEAPCEHLQPATRVQFWEGASNLVDTPFLQATTFEHEHEHERRTPNAKRLVRAPSQPLGARIGNRFDLLLREESDISQVARNQLGWRRLQHRAALGGRAAQSSGFEMLRAAKFAIAEFFRVKTA